MASRKRKSTAKHAQSRVKTGPVESEEAQESNREKYSLEKWLATEKRRKLFLGVTTVGAAVATLGVSIWRITLSILYGSPIATQDTAIFATIEAAFILAALVYFGILHSEYKRYKKAEEYEMASKAVGQFLMAWLFLLTSWLALYLYLAYCNYFPGLVGSTIWSKQYWPQLLNSVATIALLILFHVMAALTIERSEPDHAGKALSPKKKHDAGSMEVSYNTTSVAGLLLVYLVVFAILEVIEYLVIANASINLGDYCVIFGLAYYVAAGTATVMFVSRLGSMFMRVPLWITVMLFIYGSVQPLFMMLVASPIKDPKLATIVSCVLLAYALVAKVLLFIVIAWLVNSLWLHYYMAQSRNLVIKTPDLFADWLQKAP